jgi:hypothetical protein
VPGLATRAFHGLLKAALIIGVLVVALLALLLAWWIALLLVGAWLLYAGARRLLRGGIINSAARAPASVIEGEYRVEHNPQLESSPEITQPGGGRAGD